MNEAKEGQSHVDCLKLAEAHVEWFLKTIKPLLIEHFKHGFGHGYEVAENKLTKHGVSVRK